MCKKLSLQASRLGVSWAGEQGAGRWLFPSQDIDLQQARKFQQSDLSTDSAPDVAEVFVGWWARR